MFASFPPGVVLFHQPGADEQTALRILLTHHPFRFAPSQGHGRDCPAARMVLRLHYLRRKQLRNQGRGFSIQLGKYLHPLRGIEFLFKGESSSDWQLGG